MSFVRKRSDGKHELVKSVRAPGKKNPTHKVIMHLGDFATVQAAYDFNLAESKAGLRKGEGHTNAKVRRLRAGDAALVLARHLPKPKPAIALPWAQDGGTVMADLAKGAARRSDFIDEANRAWENYKLAKPLYEKLAVLREWKQDLAKQFATLRRPVGKPVSVQDRQHADLERICKKMFGTTRNSPKEFLEAIVKAGEEALIALGSPMVTGTAGEGSDKAPRFHDSSKRSKTAPQPKGPTEYVGRRR